LTDRVEGTTTFAEDFAARGPFDKQGRSLREFDLQSRMFKYRCSYLIYSEAFEKMPGTANEYVYQRLYAVLTGKDQSKEFAHLSGAERAAILEILRDTKKDLPDYWKTP